MENGERSCSIDLLIELSCILHVSTDYLLMGSEPSKEEVKNDLLSIISELSTIAKKEKRMYFDAKEFGKRLRDVRTSRGITQEELSTIAKKI